MDKEDKLYLKFEKEMKENYINNFSKLIADNIASYYKIFKNNSYITLSQVIKSSMDNICLSNKEEDKQMLLVKEILNNKYNLKVVEKEKLIIEKI